ncbi:glycoside hydrolase, family 16 [Bombardia bombarda]|uniref:Glycoside hydrolase, family 16 n=1 Tax=Bombardia bombarda TaxID=252184 RepID=A0AA39WTS8_9PEZI|nr:glycoside hydrolase, family 16 [Bombardia bombarda]
MVWPGIGTVTAAAAAVAAETKNSNNHRPVRLAFFVNIFYYWSLLFLILFPAVVLADCECGYSLDVDTHQYVFTDLVESNFARLRDISRDTDWARQAFNLTKDKARGDYGEMFAVDNIAANPSSDGGEGVTAGLQLVVRNQLVDGMVPVAEIDTERLDLYWGTFRASIKVTDVPGTCAAFFWYFNDTQEIDMEFLSKDFNPSNKSYPVNLVLQSRESAAAGYNAQSTGNFIKAYLPFDPTTAFHEYRIDYFPGQVFFYADGLLLGTMKGAAVPTSPGHLILQHWSNGNVLWSGGPPAEDAVLTIGYVKAYFNSSSTQRVQDWANRCKEAAGQNAICVIPTLDGTNPSPGDWFFSDHDNMTNNQTVYRESGGARLRGVWWLMAVVLVVACGWTMELW